jgi:DNA-binding response OmpR family regulator
MDRSLRIGGRLCHATNREFELMLFMFRRHGRVVTRESLLVHVWRLSGNVETRSIDTHVSRLRKLFGLDGSSGWRLDGVYQKGYCLKRVPESVEFDQ